MWMHDEVIDEQSWIKAKLADLEDHSRCNNVKIRGILESIPPAELPKYANDLMHAILPNATSLEISIDLIHGISKHHLAASVPRDVLMRVHFFRAKEMLLAAARSAGTLLHHSLTYSSIQIFLDTPYNNTDN